MMTHDTGRCLIVNGGPEPHSDDDKDEDEDGDEEIPPDAVLLGEHVADHRDANGVADHHMEIAEIEEEEDEDNVEEVDPRDDLLYEAPLGSMWLDDIGMDEYNILPMPHEVEEGNRDGLKRKRHEEVSNSEKVLKIADDGASGSNSSSKTTTEGGAVGHEPPLPS